MRPYPLEETWNPGRRDFKTATGRATAAATAHRGQSTQVRHRAPKAAEVTALWPLSTRHSAFRLGLAVQRLVWFNSIRHSSMLLSLLGLLAQSAPWGLGYYPMLLLSAARDTLLRTVRIRSSHALSCDCSFSPQSRNRFISNIELNK